AFHIVEASRHFKNAQAEFLLALSSILAFIIGARERLAAEKGTTARNNLLHSIRMLAEIGASKLEAGVRASEMSEIRSEVIAQLNAILEEHMTAIREDPDDPEAPAKQELLQSISLALEEGFARTGTEGSPGSGRMRKVKIA
ncbi:hypothetical protein ACFL4G_05075, partial [Thermodesulfobacteriota bacterium]